MPKEHNTEEDALWSVERSTFENGRSLFEGFTGATVEYLKLHPDAKVPAHSREGDAGMDIYANDLCFIHTGQVAVVGTGIALSIPHGYAGFVLPRSGLASNHGITVVNAPGLIDSNYRGELRVLLTRFAPEGDVSRPGYQIDPGDRIAQLVIQKVPEVRMELVEKLSESNRGTAGFGSSGMV